MQERSAQTVNIDTFVQDALEELFSGDGDTMDKALNTDLRGPNLKRVKISKVARPAPFKSKSKVA